MSAKNLKEVMHSSNLVMKPLTRWIAYGLIAYVGYAVLVKPRTVERIPANYVEYRKAKGLPDVKIEHPGPFGCIKELRLVPEDEVFVPTRN